MHSLSAEVRHSGSQEVLIVAVLYVKEHSDTPFWPQSLPFRVQQPPAAITFANFLHCSFLDRSNTANARLEGLTTDLHMTGNQYNTGLTMFFVGYILLEVIWNAPFLANCCGGCCIDENGSRGYITKGLEGLSKGRVSGRGERCCGSTNVRLMLCFHCLRRL